MQAPLNRPTPQRAAEDDREQTVAGSREDSFADRSSSIDERIHASLSSHEAAGTHSSNNPSSPAASDAVNEVLTDLGADACVVAERGAEAVRERNRERFHPDVAAQQPTVRSSNPSSPANAQPRFTTSCSTLTPRLQAATASIRASKHAVNTRTCSCAQVRTCTCMILRACMHTVA